MLTDLVWCHCNLVWSKDVVDLLWLFRGGSLFFGRHENSMTMSDVAWRIQSERDVVGIGIWWGKNITVSVIISFLVLWI